MEVKRLFYIKLDEDMNLVTTVYEPIYRGDNLKQKIIYLVPLMVGDIDMLTAAVYLNFIRSDGEPDVVMLERSEEKYKEAFYQYTLPITCKLTKYSGEVVTWMQIFSGTPSNPNIAKSGENVIQILESKNMDDYIGDWRADKFLSVLYQMKVKTDEQIAEANENIASNAEAIGENSDAIAQNAEAIAQNSEAIAQNADAISQNADAITQNSEAITRNTEAIAQNTEDIAHNSDDIARNSEAISQNSTAIGQNADAIRANINAISQATAVLAKHSSDIAENAQAISELQAAILLKADGMIFDIITGRLQLLSGNTPIGNPVNIGVNGKLITAMTINENGELVVSYNDASSETLGKVVCTDGKVYVAHIDENHVLTWTIEDAAGDVPAPVDLDEKDNWSGMDTDWGNADDSDPDSGKTDFDWGGM